jgi:hypothetical protein
MSIGSIGEKFNNAFELLKLAKESREGEDTAEAVKYYTNALCCFFEAFTSLKGEKNSRHRSLLKNQISSIYNEALDLKSKTNVSKMLVSISKCAKSNQLNLQDFGIQIRKRSTKFLKLKEGHLRQNDNEMTFPRDQIVEITGVYEKDGNYFKGRTVVDGFYCEGIFPKRKILTDEKTGLPVSQFPINYETLKTKDWPPRKALAADQILARIVDVSIRKSILGGEFVGYKLHVIRGSSCGPSQKWNEKYVWRRFKEFHALKSDLKSRFPGLKSSKCFPPKMVFHTGSNEPDIAHKRRLALGNWLRVLLTEENSHTLRMMLHDSGGLLQFLGWVRS